MKGRWGIHTTDADLKAGYIRVKAFTPWKKGVIDPKNIKDLIKIIKEIKEIYNVPSHRVTITEYEMDKDKIEQFKVFGCAEEYLHENGITI